MRTQYWQLRAVAFSVPRVGQNAMFFVPLGLDLERKADSSNLLKPQRKRSSWWSCWSRTVRAQGSCKKSILLVRLALFYVMVHGFGPNLAVVGPKLDPSFSLQLGRRQAGAGYARLNKMRLRGRHGARPREALASSQTAAIRSSIVREWPVYSASSKRAIRTCVVPTFFAIRS